MKGFSRLSSAGIDDEKKLNDFRIDSLLEEDGITVVELSTISEIQKQNRNKRLYSYLMGMTEEGADPESDGEWEYPFGMISMISCRIYTERV